MSRSGLIVQQVWTENLNEVFALIGEVVDKYNYIAIDTKFPGFPIRLAGTLKSPADHRYQTLRTNVDNILRLIQLNLTFFDATGNLPASPTGGSCVCAWQFNFREFDVDADVANPDAIEFLREYGVDFVKTRERGIDVRDFDELLMSSGAVLDESAKWITFSGGYDVGYLPKILTGRRLPETQEDFFKLISTFFPTVYDVKHLTGFCDDLHGELNMVAELLGVEDEGVCEGVCRQAGSDSLLTAHVFRKMKDKCFDGSVERYCGSLYGLDLNN